MVEVEMATDIRKFEPKSIGPFTLRQAVCVALPFVYGGPFLVFAKFIAIDTRVMIAMFLMAPVWLCGFKLDGMYLDIYAARYIYYSFLTPRKRLYKRTNTWRDVLKEVEKEEEKELLKSMNKKDQKTYQKSKHKKATVKYSKNPELAIHK